MRRKKLTEGPLDHELACELNYIITPNFNSMYALATSPDSESNIFAVQFSSLTFAVLLCTASGALAQNQPRDKYKCYVPFDTCDKPIPAELKASMAKEFGTRSECRTTEVVYYGAPDAAIEGVYCEPGPVRAMGGMFSYSVGRVSTACHAKCEIWG
ncbi:hypothetical protein HER10_EVM0008883 [Colletotrichum scovillei]|uniref:uncharacterized protein n=1 Tax=Colletotrichum scovillei TaxID=1209932 RepID=UPI0015C40161|nr:uncharacterized protein HER10_EVM0008883 [Colletotrichum scovillei]KAF4784484.1 hypothetical protein HER10_EVM0008883 [Colletotrichum scovillei]